MLLPVLLAVAQDTAAKPEVKEEVSAYNLLAILLSITAIVLALVIWGMGRALIQVSRLVLDKQKKERSALPTVLLLVMLSIAGLSSSAQQAQEAVVKTIPNYGGLSESMFNAFLVVIIAEFAAIVFLGFSIKRMYMELLPEKEAAVSKQSSLALWWNKLDKKIFTRAVPVNAEADVMLDHDYDGIRELDNALPPWWKYGFYITIVVAFVYLFHFHVMGNGKNPSQEYVAEMESAQKEKEAFDAKVKDRVDESNIKMADAAGIQAAKTIFAANCVSCHGDKGQGGAGPNLTDDYWLHKGSLNDIYQSIKHGYPDKGMQPWSIKFNPKEISQLASFIKSIHGTNPDGAKAPQGDKFEDDVKPASDSSAVKTDSSAVIKKDSTVKK